MEQWITKTHVKPDGAQHVGCSSMRSRKVRNRIGKILLVSAVVVALLASPVFASGGQSRKAQMEETGAFGSLWQATIEALAIGLDWLISTNRTSDSGSSLHSRTTTPPDYPTDPPDTEPAPATSTPPEYDGGPSG